MDWSRCCNGLAQYKDGVYQVGVFERTLQENHYYSTEYEGPAKAIICTWEDTEAWLKEVASKEQVEQAKVATEKPEMKDTEGFGKKDANDHSKPSLPPQLPTAKLNGTTQVPHIGEDNVKVQSPRSPHTFPSTSDRVGSESPGQAQKSKTEFVPPKKKLSLPQMFQFFHRKPSKPPAPLVLKED